MYVCERAIVWVCVCVCVCALGTFCQLHDNIYYYYWKQEFISRFKGRSWIGLSKKDTNGNFKWVDDTNMTSR